MLKEIEMSSSALLHPPLLQSSIGYVGNVFPDKRWGGGSIAGNDDGVAGCVSCTTFSPFSGADNFIGNEGASALAEALKANTTLAALDLGCVSPSFSCFNLSPL